MDGFKNSTRMRTFTSSADVARTAGQTVGRVQSFARGGTVRRFAEGGSVGGVDPNHASSDNEGHAQVQRSEPTTEEQRTGGGRTPLNSGYASGGKAKHFHVHKHYHEGGKITTKTKSYKAAEKEAERQAEGAGPMMKKGGIHIKAKNKGALHRDMGVPQGQKIPKSKIRSKLAHDKASGNSKGVKRDVFALNFGKGHAEGGHIIPEARDPDGYGDYATGGTINAMNTGGTINPMATGGTLNALNCGGQGYGGMATGGTRDRLAQGGVPGALGQLMARRGALPPRPGSRPPIGAMAPVLRARGGSAARSAAEKAIKAHVETPAPRGHKGLGKMIGKR